jgi:hypothetical protein
MNHEKLPDDIDPDAVKAKIEAGLTREQAIVVLKTQADHDKALLAASEPSGVEVVFSESKEKEQV